jgi:hypothetical protein
MEMSAAYMRQTSEHLGTKGFTVQAEFDQIEGAQGNVFPRTRYHCTKAPSVHLVLEAVSYPQDKDRFFLEVRQFHSLYSHSFPLDSWKFRDHQIEFKYLADRETGLGLTFVLKL